jgi:hypothetical protein
MKIKVEITENDMKKIIKEELEHKLNICIDMNKVSIFVKSKQNYKSEWETSDFKAIYEN